MSGDNGIQKKIKQIWDADQNLTNIFNPYKHSLGVHIYGSG